MKRPVAAYLFLAPVLAGAQLPTALPAGGHLIFVAGYGTIEPNTNNVLLIGDLEFMDPEVVAEFREFDARANRLSGQSASRHQMTAPYGGTNCENKFIETPSASARKLIRGTWAGDGSILQTHLGSLSFEWHAEAGVGGSYRLARITDRTRNQDLPLAVGFAYASRDPNEPVSLWKANFLPWYDGEIYHKDNNAVAATPWAFAQSGLKISVFAPREGGQVLSYTSPGTIPGLWVQNSILLNSDYKSGYVFYQDLGHDFNRNGCYDERGHTKLILGANEGDDRLLRRLVYVDYSYAADGFPMLAVGRYHGGN